MFNLRILIATIAILVPIQLTAGSPVPKIPKISTTELACLTENIYHEARGEPLAGQIMVGRVTINRKHSGKFPNTICGVVYQPKQFSWTLKKKQRKINKTEWDTAKYAAYSALVDNKRITVMYYHNLTVAPAWGRPYIMKIGNHKFYA